MNIEITPNKIYCGSSKLRINDLPADFHDFGSICDNGEPDEDDDEDFYGCYDMQFEPSPSTAEVLTKYNITPAEYLLITNLLTAELSFGSCDMCN